MIYDDNIKLFVLFTSFMLLASCSQFEDNSTSIDFRNKSHIDHIDSYIYYDSKEFELFLVGLNNLKVGAIDKAKEIFIELKSSSNKESSEYGEYGLLLIAYETDNMPNMKRQLQIINNINSKSEWLKNEYYNYYVLYNFLNTNFEKVEELLISTKDRDLIKNPTLASVQSALYLRENKINEAIEVLKRLEVENDESIATMANLISLTQGNDKTIDYLLIKKNDHNNEFLELLYNQYLVQKDKQSAYNNVYTLGMKTQNTFILVYSIELLFPDARDDEVLIKLNMLQNRLNSLEAAKNYIDYYLNRIALPINNDELNRNILIADKFNPMNYRLLWHKYYNANENEKLEYLHKIEKIDPYDTSILIELARFYNNKSMHKELDDIRQRFNNSNRLKTEAEIEFINSL